MKRLYWMLVAALVLVVAATAGAQMQPPPSGQPGQQHPMPGGGTGMGSGMCPMMMGGGMTGGGGMPMMGMMGSQPESARAMQMRGEMMKAMGDVLIKYGKMMEGAK